MDVVSKLREWADWAADRGNYPTNIAKRDLGLGTSVDAECDLFCLLACEIERNYFPLPRYKDGGPVQFGGEVEGCNGPVDAMLIYSDGSGRVYGEYDNFYKDPLDGAIIDEGLKRPAPKVLDPEGIEVNAGDKVWLTEYGIGKIDNVPQPLTVVGVGDGRIMATDAGEYADAFPWYLEPCDITHREPDSYEKLRDDMAMTHDAADEPCSTTEEWIDRLTALIERGV